MAKFLTDSWFDEVDKMRAEAGEIQIPEIIKNIVINISVTGHPDGDKSIHMAGGEFKRGHTDGAGTKITLPFEVTKAIFIDQDQNAGMQAFMSGQIVVEGDMGVIMQMQAAGEPSAEAKTFAAKVQAITEV